SPKSTRAGGFLAAARQTPVATSGGSEVPAWRITGPSASSHAWTSSPTVPPTARRGHSGGDGAPLSAFRQRLVSTDCSTGLLREVPATAATAAATTTRAAWTSDGTTMVTSGWIPTMVNPPAAAPNVTNTAEDTVMGIALWRARAPWSWDVGVPV